MIFTLVFNHTKQRFEPIYSSGAYFGILDDAERVARLLSEAYPVSTFQVISAKVTKAYESGKVLPKTDPLSGGDIDG